MIVRNRDRDSVLGTAIAVAATASKRAKGLLGRDALADGEGLLFKKCSSLHTFFMRFPIDIIYTDRDGRVLKVAHEVPPFRICVAPLRAYYAIELPAGSVSGAKTRVRDHLTFLDEEESAQVPATAETAA